MEPLAQEDQGHIGAVQDKKVSGQAQTLLLGQENSPFPVSVYAPGWGTHARRGLEYPPRKWDTLTGNQRGRAPGKDVMEMVKGITRQVILVKSPDPKLFEEAIFIVKEEALAREGVSADQVIRQARQAADGYLKSGRAWNRKLERLDRFRGPIWGAAGAAAASAAWYAALFLL